MEDYLTLLQQRYATKNFDGTAIEEADIDKLIESVRMSASSVNFQPWSLVIVTDPALKEKLKPASFNQNQITTCSHLFVMCANKNVADLAKQVGETMASRDISQTDVDAYLNMAMGYVNMIPESEHLAWSQRQLYIALSNLMNAAKSLGYDSCPMEGFDPVKYSELLELPDHLVPTVLCPVGNAADEPRNKVRFTNEQIIFARK